MSSYKPASLMGRLQTGAARDAGSRVHFVPSSVTQYQSVGKALCGAKPGGSSGGWDVVLPVGKFCTRCVTRLERLNKEGRS